MNNYNFQQLKKYALCLIIGTALIQTIKHCQPVTEQPLPAGHGVLASNQDPVNNYVIKYFEPIPSNPEFESMMKGEIKTDAMTGETALIAYVNRFKDVAISEMKKFGVPASITLAQGILESRSGNSKLARTNKNHFGIKCFSRKCKKGHCTNHFDDSHKDFFKVYKTDWNSYRDHSLLLQKKRYKDCFKCKDFREWSVCLQSKGYATNKKYSKKLIRIIEKYNLNRFDK